MNNIKTFVSNPISSMMFMLLIGISYLYIENRQVYQSIIESHETEIIHLRMEIQELQDDYHVLNDKFIDAIKSL